MNFPLIGVLGACFLGAGYHAFSRAEEPPQGAWQANGGWRTDLAAAMDEAKLSKRPLLAVFR